MFTEKFSEIDSKCRKKVCYTLVCLLIPLVVVILFYYILCINYLIEYYTICKNCENSRIWPYLLTSLLFTFANLKNFSSDENTKKWLIYILKGIIVDFSFCIWGLIEIFINCCDNIKYTNFWFLCIIMCSVQGILSFCFICVFPIVDFCD